MSNATRWALAPDTALVRTAQSWYVLPARAAQPLSLAGTAQAALQLAVDEGLDEAEINERLAAGYGVALAEVEKGMRSLWSELAAQGVIERADDDVEREGEGMRILTVCTGNVCRSVYAQHVLSHGLGDGFDVASAGTGAGHGRPVPRQVEALLNRQGLSASGHRARGIDPSLIDGADLVLTATAEHRRLVLEAAPLAFKRTFTVLEAAAAAEFAAGTFDTLPERVRALARARTAIPSGTPLDVADPFGLDDRHYESMAGQLAPALETIHHYLAARR